MKHQARAAALEFRRADTYIRTAVFVAASVILPQVCHAFGISGQVFIPIMFFALFAAIRFGLVCGLLTAVFSPIASFLISGMPDAAILPVIVVKSAALATVLGAIIAKRGRINFLGVLAAVVSYQIAGFLLQGAVTGDFAAAWNAVAISWPGMLIQFAAGSLMAWLIFRNN